MASSSDIQRIFRHAPGRFLVLQPDAGFTIAAASDEYLAATHTRPDIFGRPVFEVFPDNPAWPDGQGRLQMQASLQRVLATRAPDALPTLRYDMRLPASASGGFEQRQGSAVNAPVLAADGSVEYILHRFEEASTNTDRDAWLAESERQRAIYETALDSTPDFVYVFDTEHRAIYANAALLKTWGVDDVRGKRWMDLGYEQWHADLHDAEIDRVIATRAPIRGEIPFTGTNGRRIYDYIFAPVLDADGEVVAVAGTTRDITDREAAEEAVREQARQLAEADRAKDEFLATLSHELRNPLAPLRSATELLRRVGPTEGPAVRLNDIMERQVKHLIRLVDDLLDLSRISRGEFSLRTERVDLADIVRNAVETCDSLIQRRGHALAIELPDDALRLDGDPVRLTQVLANLLNNAAHYTEHAGRIVVRAWRDGAQAVVSVQDNGIGIDAKALPRLFEMFNRGDRHGALNQGGLGIGLALSRRLAQRHGGTLEARSAGLGQGSEFTLRLPLVDIVNEVEADAAPAHDGLGGLRVLVVDDNRDAAESLALLLSTLGAEVSVAHDGPQGLAAFDKARPAIVLLDIGMPGMNGYDVAQAIRARFPESPATLVALTGWGQDDDRARARRAGFDHHLVKPAQIESLQELLASAR